MGSYVKGNTIINMYLRLCAFPCNGITDEQVEQQCSTHRSHAYNVVNTKGPAARGYPANEGGRDGGVVGNCCYL